jgi:small conductance mechanosensitive channel
MERYADWFLTHGSELMVTYGLRVLGALVLVVVGWLVATWAARAVQRAVLRSERLDETVARYLGKMTRITVMAIVLIAVLNNFGVETNSIVAFLGAMGLAIGLALRGTLSNVASGIVLLVLRPFKVGDAVEAGGTLGVIQEIGLFATELKSFDGLYVLVPNSSISEANIINITRNGTRRVELVFGIAYEDDMDRALAIVEEAIAEDPRVLAEPAPLVKVAELGDSSVNIWARPWTNIGDFLDLKLHLTKTIKERFDAAGISIPFPQRDIHVQGALVEPPKQRAA